MLKSINLKQIRESTHQIIYISFLRELQLPTRSTHLLTKLTVLCVKLYSSSPTQRAFSSEAQKSKRQTSQASFALRTADCGLLSPAALWDCLNYNMHMCICRYMYICTAVDTMGYKYVHRGYVWLLLQPPSAKSRCFDTLFDDVVAHRCSVLRTTR